MLHQLLQDMLHQLLQDMLHQWLRHMPLFPQDQLHKTLDRREVQLTKELGHGATLTVAMFNHREKKDRQATKHNDLTVAYTSLL
jgi:hypothetical protein